MKRRIPLVVAGCSAALAVALFAMSGCVSPPVIGAVIVPPGRPAQGDAGAQSSGQFVGAINDFGVDLLKTTAAGSSENVVVSPASVHAALSMVANGATDETEKQMRIVLRTDSMSRAEANEQWSTLLAHLAETSDSQRLTVANSLWAREGIAFEEPFIEADRTYFGAGISTLDFQNDDVGGAVNGWVSKNTHGMITKMLEKGPKDNAILYVANAVYFKGDWISPFKHELTQKSQFTRADGSKVNVDMMSATDDLPYAESVSMQATRLSYKGGDSAYYVLLPKEGVSLDTAISSLEGTGFSVLRRTLLSRDPGKVEVGLPKLDTEYSANLARHLALMGMPRAFDEHLGQFSDMATLDAPIFLDSVLHKTKIKIDEEGTEAAAATVIGVTAGMAGPESLPHRIICDRPYVFAIVDERSGAMLFLGAVNDPAGW